MSVKAHAKPRSPKEKILLLRENIVLLTFIHQTLIFHNANLMIKPPEADDGPWQLASHDARGEVRLSVCGGNGDREQMSVGRDDKESGGLWKITRREDR